MKTATRNNKVKIKDIKNKMKNERFLQALEGAVYFLLSFVLARNFVLSYASPFAVSLICVSRKKNYFYSAVGAAVGYLVFIPESFARYIAAVIIVFLGTLAIDLASAKGSPFMPMLISFLSLFATGIVVDIKTGASMSEYALTLAESLLGAGGSFFFFRALNCNFRRFRLRALPVSDLTCIVISCSLILMSLSEITIARIAPARIVALLLILITVIFGTDRLGLMLALSVGFAFSLQGDGALFLTGAYGFSALLACLFCPFGTFGAVSSFTLSFALFSVAAGGGIEYFAEALISGIAVMLFPSVLQEKIENFFHDGENITPDGSLRKSLVMRLRFASGAISYISESVNEVSERINDLNNKNAKIRREHQTEQQYLTQQIINEKTNQIRMVAADQFFSISDMLGDLAREFDEAEYFDNIAAGKLRRALAEREIYPKNISVIEDKFGRMRIEILTQDRETAFCDPEINREISKACQRYFSNGRITHFKNNSMITFTEKPNFSLEIGFSQHSAEGALCGDTVKTINDSRGRSILIISDGMGKGGRAALDGAMGAGLLSKLLAAGFGFDSSLRVVNSALLVKSSDESLATLDCAGIDLFTGKVDLYKAGAPATYIVKGSKVTKCELSSMPAGILRGIEFAKRTAVLSDGDLLVMVSDGITDPGADWLNAFLTGTEDMSVQQIADEIINQTLNMTKGMKQDDMSVIAARLKKYGE